MKGIITGVMTHIKVLRTLVKPKGITNRLYISYFCFKDGLSLVTFYHSNLAVPTN